MTLARGFEAATVTLTYTDGKTLTLDFTAEPGRVLESELSVTAEMREVPSDTWLRREPTGHKTGHLTLAGPVVRTEHGRAAGRVEAASTSTPDWALELLAAVEYYEDVHPKVEAGRDCLGAALAAIPAEVRAEARGWARAKRALEAAKTTAAPTVCDRPGCACELEHVL